MSNASALGPVQAILYTTLNVPAVTSLAPVVDLVPEGQSYPYIEIGELEELPNNTYGKNGREVHVTIHVYSDSPGYKESEAIIEQLNVLLDDTLLPNPAGWKTWLSEYAMGSLQKEFNVVEVRHSICRYHFEVSQP